MKGLVFTEFMELVESKFGEDMVDDLIDETNPASDGAYTAVGTYNHQELIDMVVVLSERVDVPVPDLVNVFGHHLAEVFATKFKSFFDESWSTIEFLKSIDNHIHVEVLKLYPDAELPEFSFDDSNPDAFQLNYRSTRGFADLAHGLIQGTAKYYGEDITINRVDSVNGDHHETMFSITHN